MRKLLTASVLLVALQLIMLIWGLWLSVTLHSGCSFMADDPDTWQCTSSANPTIAPIIAFIVLPPLLARFILIKVGSKISWKSLIATHAITAVLVWIVLHYGDQPTCACGMP